MSEPTPDRLKALQEHEMETVFPDVLSDLKALCTGDPIALLSKTFDERKRAWEERAEKYEDNQYLGNFFSDTIRGVLAIKERAYRFEQEHGDLIAQYRKSFNTIPDGVTIDVLFAILLNRLGALERYPSEQEPGYRTILHHAHSIILELSRANSDGRQVMPKEMTLEYVLRAVLEKKVLLGEVGG
jgi:hypothetical protein